MKILSFGSLNLDYVYRLPHIVVPRETISSNNINIFAGGKGLNQSAAAIAALQHTPQEKTAASRHPTHTAQIAGNEHNAQTAPIAHNAPTTKNAHNAQIAPIAHNAPTTKNAHTAPTAPIAHTAPTAHNTPTAPIAHTAQDTGITHTAQTAGNEHNTPTAPIAHNAQTARTTPTAQTAGTAHTAPIAHNEHTTPTAHTAPTTHHAQKNKADGFVSTPPAQTAGNAQIAGNEHNAQTAPIAHAEHNAPIAHNAQTAHTTPPTQAAGITSAPTAATDIKVRHADCVENDDRMLCTDIKVLHAGCVGTDDRMLCAELQRRGVDTTFTRTVETPTGHAIIQVAESGENAIIIYGGANRDICPAHITEAINACAADDILLLQNEINAIPEIMTAASQRNMRIFFNAAPCNAQVAQYPLHLVDTLIVNEVEGEMLSGQCEPRHIIAALTARYPRSAVIVTIGAKGALYGCGTTRHHATAPSFKVVDTTGAGDTFVGYYAASIASACTPADAMHIACHAASLSITRQGAAASIPYYWEVAPHIQH